MTAPFRPRGPSHTIRVLDVGGREPPNNADVEAALVASILRLGGAALDELGDALTVDDWYVNSNRRVHEAAIELHRAQQPVDLQTVAAWLKDRDLLIAIGGVSYLAKLLDSTPAVAHLEAYAKIVADKARARRLIDACQRVVGDAFEDNADVDALVDRSAQTLTTALEQRTDTGLTVAWDAVQERVPQLQAQWDGDRSARGIPTGLDELDELTNGLRAGGLSVVAAVTGGGKSAFALQVARAVAGTEHNGEKLGVVYVSLEMPVEELVDRTLCSMIGVSDEQLQAGAFTPEQGEALRVSIDALGRLPLWFYTAPTSVHVIRSLVRRAKQEFTRHSSDPTTPRRIGLVVVDYLGLMDRPDAERNDLAIGAITRGLKLLAMELGVHVMLLAQFNRDASNGTEPPKLRDLKDSSSIEQDANLVIFLHMLFLLLPDRSTEDARALRDCVEIIVAKARRRGTGSVFARFNGSRFQFEAPHAGDVERWDRARPKPRARQQRNGGRR